MVEIDISPSDPQVWEKITNHYGKANRAVVSYLCNMEQWPSPSYENIGQEVEKPKPLFLLVT